MTMPKKEIFLTKIIGNVKTFGKVKTYLMGYFVWISETWYRTYKEPKLHDANKQRNKKRLKEPKKEKCYYHLTKLVRIVF